MSDPMTNTEVEDVLASIRRLVSDDKRPETVADERPTADRLVLTPSLRVKEAPTAQDTVIIDAPMQLPVQQDEPVDEAPVWPQSVSKLRAQEEIIVDTLHAAPTAEDGEPQTDAAADTVDHQTTPEQDVTPDHGKAVPQEVIPEAPFVFVDTDLDEPTDIEYMGDTADADRMADHKTATLDADDVSDAPFLAVEDDALQEKPADPSATVAQTLTQKIEALETLVSVRDDEFEPESADADDYAGTEAPAMAWEDSDEPLVFAAFVEPEQPAKEEEPEPAPLFSSDEDVLDEDALRELISDIVREELQGALGERITRNVRKLVRREIHRALAAQELE